MKIFVGLVLVLTCAITSSAYVYFNNNRGDDGADRTRLLRDGGAAMDPYDYESLADLIRSSDVIVEGQVVRIEDGNTLGQAGRGQVFTIFVYVEVSSTIRGTAETTVLPVELPIGNGDYKAEYLDALSDAGGMWFLFDKEKQAQRLGLTGTAVTREVGLYMLAGSQGLVVNVSGTSSNLFASDEEASVFRATDQQPFAAVRAEVETASKSIP